MVSETAVWSHSRTPVNADAGSGVTVPNITPNTPLLTGMAA